MNVCRWIASTYIVLSGFFLFADILQAEDRGLSFDDVWFRNISLAEGLVNTTVYSMHQDSRGFFWLATQAGVVRYDGYQFQTFLIDSDQTIPAENLADRILEDANGNIWVGYQDNHHIGVYRLEASTFEFLNMRRLVDSADSVRHTRLIGIDKQDRLWVSLLSWNDFQRPVIASIDTKTMEITALLDESGKSFFETLFVGPQFFASFVNFQGFLSGEDGSVWIAAQNGLLYIAPDGTPVHFNEENGYADVFTSSFLEYGDYMLIGNNAGLSGYSLKENRFELPQSLSSLADVPVSYLYRDRHNRIWITSDEETYHYKNGFLTSLNDNPKLYEALSGVSVFPIAEDDEYIWFVNKAQTGDMFSTTYGIGFEHKPTSSYQLFLEEDPDGNGFRSTNFITSILIDNAGSVWVSTQYNGLLQFPRGHRKFTNHFKTPELRQEVGSNQFFYRVFESPEGHVFAGSTSGVVLTIHAETGEESVFKRFVPAREDVSGQRNLIAYMLWEREGVVLIATEWSGLNRVFYNPRTLEVLNVRQWIPPDMNTAGIPTNLIYDKNGILWVGQSTGVTKADLNNNRFESFYLMEPRGYHPHNEMGYSSTIDQKGRLWFFEGRDAGIKMLDPDTKEMLHLNKPGEVPDEEAIHVIRNVIVSNDGKIYASGATLWVLDEEEMRFLSVLPYPVPGMNVTLEYSPGVFLISSFSRGVVKFDLETLTLTSLLSTANGANNDMFTDIHIDSHGNLWGLNALGVVHYDFVNDVVTNYTVDHGLESSTTTISYRFFKGTFSGNVYPTFVGSNSLDSFNPNHILPNPFSPTPVFSEISSNRRKLSPTEAKITLPYNENNLNISFSTLNFTDISRNSYRFRLNSEAWSDWSNNHSLQFAGLAPGLYNLDVAARNQDGIPSDGYSTITFQILPPWYMSTLALLLYALGAGGLLVFGFIRFSNYRDEQTRLRYQAEQAHELQKLDRMKTNLLINISHELRTPLTLVLGPIEQISRQIAPGESVLAKNLEIARRNGQRLQQLVEQVLDVTRLDADRMDIRLQATELNSLLKRLLESFESMADRKQITLKSEIPAEKIHAELDLDKFQKVMVNLLSNAIKFTPEKGVVTLRLSSEANRVKIAVADNGRGIDPERIDSVFDRFHSTSERVSGGGQGLGVGLSISKEFIEMHQGSIAVESVPEKGSVFTVNLPAGKLPHITNITESTDLSEIVPVSSSSEIENSFHRSVENGNSETILVVEDNADMRGYIIQLLENENLSVISAPNGIEARKALALQKPDLIISDIMMPEMDGFEFISHVRSVPDFRDIPIVVLSARAEQEDRIHGYSIGVSDFLIKPFSEIELLARVTNLLSLKRERDQLQEETEEYDIEPSEEVAFIKSLQDFIESNIRETEITVEQLCDAAAISRSNLYRRLKSATGHSPAEFVREIKLNRARMLLERRQKRTISEVCYAVGFGTPSYFTRMYRSRYGKNPKEYLQ